MNAFLGRHKISLFRWLVLFGFLGFWELLIQTGTTSAFWTSAPSLMAERLWQLASSGELAYHTWITLEETFAGLAAGTAAGVALGLLIGVSRNVGAVFEPFVIALNSLPRVALGPLIVMYVGIGFASKFLLAFSLVVVAIMLNTYEGIRSVDRTLVDLMRKMGATRWQTFQKLLLPNCIPWIFSALRVSISFAIIGAIVGEFISSRAGIGFMIDTASGAFDTTGIMVPLFVLMIVAFGMDRILVHVSNRLLRWRPRDAE